MQDWHNGCYVTETDPRLEHDVQVGDEWHADHGLFVRIWDGRQWLVTSQLDEWEDA
jgi:hypothetical protein